MSGRVLVIEDELEMCRLLEAGLSRRGYTVLSCTSGHAGLKAVDEWRTDLVLADINLPDKNGLDICKTIAQQKPDIPVIIMTAFGSMDSAIGAIRAGAYDFIPKPLDLDMLSLTLDRAMKYRSLQRKVKMLEGLAVGNLSFESIVGESPAMKRFFEQLSRIADSEATLLITGESGSGKELTARAVHRQSRRRERPLISINCSAIPPSLLESELFGHRKGAFTDAHAHHKGLFLEADGGTLFLDEVGEIPLELQPKLLRALEERCVRPVGSHEEKPVDVRIISATNRDLESAVMDGLFREDLFYRLNVIKVELPPLRSRGTDILLLARLFVDEIATLQQKPVTGIAEAAAAKLLSYDWPGNVRELRNAMEHAVALTRFDTIVPEDLPEKIQLHQNDYLLFGNPDPMALVTMEEMEKRYITYVLKSTGGNRTLASRILKVDRKTLYRKLQKYE